MLAALAGVPGVCADLGWSLTETQPDFSGADDVFATLRGWLMAHGTAAPLGDRLLQMKQTIQIEAATGAAVSAAEVYAALAHLGVLWRRAAAFFDDHDLLLCPVSQVSPFPVETEYPTVVAGRPMGRYIEWMQSCSRITVLGSPAASVPAGFTATGMPTGVQIVGGPNADALVLRAAKSFEQATGGHYAHPPTL